MQFSRILRRENYPCLRADWKGQLLVKEQISIVLHRADVHSTSFATTQLIKLQCDRSPPMILKKYHKWVIRMSKLLWACILRCRHMCSRAETVSHGTGPLACCETPKERGKTKGKSLEMFTLLLDLDYGSIKFW